MKKAYHNTIAFFNTIQSKIAFYPSVLAFLGFNLSFIMAWFESKGISKYLLEHTPQLMLKDGDTALTLMSVCIAGLVSMMVFSFSMVMLLLSQASSNFSPRILPGLISDKKNQVILGTYLATILYLIFTLFSIAPDDKKYTLPGLSIILGITLTIVCLASFIYFIHNMSQSIQITNILDTIFYKSKKRLRAIIELEKEKDEEILNSFPDSSEWYSYTTQESGYFQNVSFTNLLKISEENNTRIHIAIPKGFFVLQNQPFIFSEKELSDEILEDVLSNLNFSRGELVEDNYILAFKQITEIAVKAMSPGINDPGTAINAIDYLTELFSLRMKKSDKSVLLQNGTARIKLETVSFEELLYTTMASLRTYCTADPIVTQKLVWMLNYLHNEDAFHESYTSAIIKALKEVMKDSKQHLTSKVDRKRVKQLAKTN